MAYKCNKMRIVFYHTNDDKCLLIYAPEYMCANYVFDSENRYGRLNKTIG